MAGTDGYDAELLILRSYELRLIRCTIPSTPAQYNPYDHHLHSHINELISSIEVGQYFHALSSSAARLVFKLADEESPEVVDDSVECAERVYSNMMERVVSFIVNDSEDVKDMVRRAMVVLCLSIAAFLSFTQCNMTGPLKDLPKCPLPLKMAKGNVLNKWDEWARNQLLSSGSLLLSKFSNLQYIVFARMLLTSTKDVLFQEISDSVYEIKSISWWLARLSLLQQRILDERSSSLFDLLQVVTSETLNNFGTLEKVTSYWGAMLHDQEASTIVSVVHLEAGIMEYSYGRVDACRVHFQSAEVATGLELSVTGVLGFRTIHQVEPKAQMVLVATTTASNIGDTCPPISPDIRTHESTVTEETLHLQQSEFGTSDILKIPKLLENGNNPGIRADHIHNGHTPGPWMALQQALILAQCLLIEKSTRNDELQRWDMAPYIEAIDSQLYSCFIIQCFCNILRIRWESTRSHTKERALLMMDKLVQGLREPSPGVAQRILFCFGVYIPTISALRKEYGELLVRCGLIGEAVKLFEDLELWDNVIYCYCLMEKKAAAVELIKERLSEVPNDPKLWCSLGDVTNNDSCYEKALEVSNNRSARAMRSLARNAYNRGDYEKSKILWESAMALNSLHPDGWFALGAAALKARDVEKALDGFTRAVQLDPENGEAWNNIACLHMIKKRSKESFIAFKEALKFKRNSWQLWENYSHVALDIGNIPQALEAIRMVLDITNNKRIDTELLERIMTEIEGRASSGHSVSAATTHEYNLTDETPPDSVTESTGETTVGVGRSRETEQLLEFLGKILQQVVRSVGGAEMWGLYARWLKTKGDLTMCSEALLKQVRLYQGSDLWKDIDRFKKFAHASLELCRVYMDISSTTGGHRELLSAEMHLKNIVKQAGSFSDTPEFEDLQACLVEVKEKLESQSVRT